MAYGDGQSRVYVCEAADGKPLLDLRLGSGRNWPAITELAFSPDGRTLAASGWWCKTLWLIDLAMRKVRSTIPNPEGGPLLMQGPTLAFTPDGRTLIVGGKDGGLHFWDPMTGIEQAALAKTMEPVLSLTLTADGRTATAHHGGALHLWDVANRQHLRKLARPWSTRPGPPWPQMGRRSPCQRVPPSWSCGTPMAAVGMRYPPERLSPD